MNNQDINTLQNIVMGQLYNEAIINRAIEVADTLEVSVCLRALRGGRSSFSSRMVLQDFVCRLEQGL